jgi:ABC-type uncharacterized transport system permease subunit
MRVCLRRCEQRAASGRRPRLLYTIPTYHNPAGVSLSAPRRRRLLELARREDLVLVEDDVYRELAYTGKAPPALRALDPAAPVVRLGSFSKSLAPGLRLGWIDAPSALRERLSADGVLESGGCVSQLSANLVAALLAVAAAQLMMTRHIAGYQVKVLGMAPRAARFAGFSEERIIWGCFLLSGALAGLAGLFEAAGPVGQLVPALPVGYGFTAIIVAFLGRLHPVGILLAGLLIGLTYIGGEAAQIAMRLPSATISIFQGLLLFFLLASDVLVRFRPVWRPARRAAKTGVAPAPAE